MVTKAQVAAKAQAQHETLNRLIPKALRLPWDKAPHDYRMSLSRAAWKALKDEDDFAQWWNTTN